MTVRALSPQPHQVPAIGQMDPELMHAVPLLAGLAPPLVHSLLAESQLLRCLAGDTLILEGEMPDFLHIVIDGEIGLYGGACDGEETLVNIAKAGDLFIAAAVLLDRPYLMTGRALSPARVLALPAARLRRDLRRMPDLAVAMTDALSGHFRILVREVKQLKLKTVGQRLGLYLLSLTPRREGPAVVWLPHSKRTVAARIGARPESLSRAFASLRGQGVQVDSTRISIADIGQLTDYCEGDEVPV